MYLKIDDIRNKDMERRCVELSANFKSKDISFGFFASRKERLLKPLKYLIVYHEARANDGRERIVSNAAALELNVMQREYSRSMVDHAPVLQARQAPRMTIQTSDSSSALQTRQVPKMTLDPEQPTPPPPPPNELPKDKITINPTMQPEEDDDLPLVTHIENPLREIREEDSG